MIPPRVMLEDVSLGSQRIASGDWVTAYIAAANRDPARFTDPDVFDVTRVDAASHVGFGAGIHFCLGAPLARIEGRIVLDALLRRAPNYELAKPDEPIQFQSNPFLRTMSELVIVA
jgi:cytochrome P450